MDNGPDQRAEAWMAVWEKLNEKHPGFGSRTESGLQAALREIDRLYEIERAHAVRCLRSNSGDPNGR